jgi:hypothetical protein
MTATKSTAGWLPISTAPKQKVILLWALTDTDTGNWKMATGYWMPMKSRDRSNPVIGIWNTPCKG